MNFQQLLNITCAKAQVHHIVRPYWNFIREISEIDGILFRVERVILNMFSFRHSVSAIFNTQSNTERITLMSQIVKTR